jgi:protein-L-isoaspartate(D-aspartate) O-methyltransferase
LIDNYRHKGLRRKLVEMLAKKGIESVRVLSAMEVVPRHFFLDKTFESKAYVDKAFPIGNNQTISQPFTVAFQTQLLEVKKREKILEIGTGSGYQAAILGALGARVFTVERQEPLYKKAKNLLRELGLGNIRCYFKDGTRGLAEFAPFDKIIVTAGAEEVPKALFEQLKIGGFLVIPVGDDVQKMLRIVKVAQDKWRTDEFGDFKFVPFLGGVVK